MQTIDGLILALQSIKRDLGISGDAPVFLPGYNDYGVVQPGALRSFKVSRNDKVEMDGETQRMWVSDEKGVLAVLIQRDPDEKP